MPINGHFKAIANFEVSITYNTQIYESFVKEQFFWQILPRCYTFSVFCVYFVSHFVYRWLEFIALYFYILHKMRNLKYN